MRTFLLFSLLWAWLLQPLYAAFAANPLLTSTATSRALLSRFQELSPPTLLWIGLDAEKCIAQRIPGDVAAEPFLHTGANTQERG